MQKRPRSCKSVTDIGDKFAEMMYDQEKGKIVCSVCEGEISYGVEEERDFKGKVQSSKFRNLKL